MTILLHTMWRKQTGEHELLFKIIFTKVVYSKKALFTCIFVYLVLFLFSVESNSLEVCDPNELSETIQRNCID